MQKGKRDLDTKKRIKRRQQRTLLKVGLSLFILVGVCTLLYSVPRFPQLTIEQVSVHGNEVVSTATIERTVEDKLSGFYVHFFPRRTAFLYPKEALTEALQTLDPHIESASVSLSNFHTLEVEVLERKPFALYCGSEVVATSSTCYFLDEDGYIFSDAPQFSDAPFISFYGTTTAPIITSHLLRKDEFKAVSYTVQELAKLHYEVIRIALKEEGLVEMTLKIGAKILFAQDSDYGKALNNLKALVSSDSFKEKNAEGMVQVDYIDLRFGNKVFYKSRK